MDTSKTHEYVKFVPVTVFRSAKKYLFFDIMVKSGNHYTTFTVKHTSMSISQWKLLLESVKSERCCIVTFGKCTITVTDKKFNFTIKDGCIAKINSSIDINCQIKEQLSTSIQQTIDKINDFQGTQTPIIIDKHVYDNVEEHDDSDDDSDNTKWLKNANIQWPD